MVFTDSLTSEALKSPDFALTETPHGVELVILNSGRLAAIRKLNRPVLRFRYRGRLMVADGIPLLSSEIPAQAEAFYTLGRDHTVHFWGTRLSVLLVNKVVRQKYRQKP